MRSLRQNGRGIFTGLFIFILFSSHSQINNFKRWSVKDGLIQSDVYDVLEDARGYLWIATGGGVSVFDGIAFKHLTKTNGLAGNVVRCLFEDSKGRIWLGTNEGVCFNDGEVFHKLSNKNFKGSTALCFGEDRQQNILVGTDDGGLNILTFTGDSLSIQNVNEENGLGGNSVFDLEVDDQNKIWMAVYGSGLNIAEKAGGEYKISSIKGPGMLPSDQLVTIDILNDEVWLGTYDAGAFLFSKKQIENNQLAEPRVFDTSTGLSSNAVWNILCASDNKVWIGTLEKGISRLERKNGNYNITHFNDKNGLSDNQILRVYEDKQQMVWVGTNGNGLNLCLGDHFSHYSSTDGLPSNRIQSVQQENKNKFWLAGSGSGLSQLEFSGQSPLVKNYRDASGLTDFISSIAIGKADNKNIWFGTDDHGLVKFKDSKFYNFTERDGLVNNRVYSVYVDSNGIVWSGTADGISRYDGIRFLNISTDKMKMESEGVKTIIEGRDHSIWFGTSGGLARYNGEGDLRTFDEVEGLQAKDVNALASHASGDIYIGTNSGGIYKYNHLKNDTNAIEFVLGDSLLLSNSIRSLLFLNSKVLVAGTYGGCDKIMFDKNMKVERVKHYRREDGFTGIECNDNALILDSDSNIWFGTVNGLTKFVPALEKLDLQPPRVFITDLQLSYKDVNWKDRGLEKQKWFNLPLELTLSYDENELTFKFHSNNLSNYNNLEYKIFLEGNDKDWSPPRKNREVTFSGLAPNSYTFKVMAMNEAGVWSEPATFTFRILPPWYRTTTFYVLVVLFLILGVYVYIKWRERKLVKEKEELEKVVKERTHEVEVQKEHLAEINKEITDSINYAKGIQSAMLPPLSDIQSAWKEVCVFFQPKDIVSGDFYWFHRINPQEFLIACADCTGHGVPGGFMSMVCSGELHDAVKESTEPAQILRMTNNGVKKLLRQQSDAAGKNKDGMEICLLKVNTVTSEVSYSGANRLLWVINGHTKELSEIKPTKASIASFTEFDFEYQQVDLKLKKGDLLYTTSDGYPDQFGGSDGKKYMSKNLKNLIVENCELPMAEQAAFFKNDISTWMRNCEQVDDLLVIGIRL